MVGLLNTVNQSGSQLIVSKSDGIPPLCNAMRSCLIRRLPLLPNGLKINIFFACGFCSRSFQLKISKQVFQFCLQFLQPASSANFQRASKLTGTFFFSSFCRWSFQQRIFMVGVSILPVIFVAGLICLFPKGFKINRCVYLPVVSGAGHSAREFQGRCFNFEQWLVRLRILGFECSQCCECCECT